MSGFTLIELLVVVGIIALLLGVLLTSLSRAQEAARSASCSSNLRQLGVGITMYLGEYPDQLPQMRVDPGTGQPVQGSAGANIGALFGGKKGTLPFYGINEVGPQRRPLNEYVFEGDIVPDSNPASADIEMEIFRDPGDRGVSDPFLEGQGLDTSSTYDLLGSSYNLNDHALDTNPAGDDHPTLIPREGGKMPLVDDPSRTWLLGDQPIYNYDDGGDREQHWHFGRVSANLLFVDMHVDSNLQVEEGIVNDAAEYTFLPSADWIEPFQD